MYAKDVVHVADVYQFIQGLDSKSKASLNEYIGGHGYEDRARCILGMLPSKLNFARIIEATKLCQEFNVGGAFIDVNEFAFAIATSESIERFSHASKYLQVKANYLANQFKGYVRALKKGEDTSQFDVTRYLQVKAELLMAGMIQKAEAREAKKNKPKRVLTEAQVAAIAKRKERTQLWSAFDSL